MSFVALQFEDNQVFVASARASSKRLQVSNLFAIDLSGDDSNAAELLKTKLAKHGLSRCDAIIVISRADAEMRELVVPPAPDREIPDMVRFIARNEFASLNENWALDYLPISGDETQSRNVLAVGISPEYQEQVKSLVKYAGLKVKHVVLRPFASIDLVRDRLGDGESRLIVDPNGDQTDMTIIDGESLLATRTVLIPNSYDANRRAETMLSEIRRTLASSRKLLNDKKISEVLMFGDEDHNKSLAGNLRNQLDLEIQFVEPLSLVTLSSGCETPGDTERYAAVLGSLVQQHSHRPHAIDFLNPRRPIIVKNDYSKWYLYGGLALAASLLVVVIGWMVLNNQSSINEKYATKLLNLKTLTNGNDTRPSVDKIMAEINKIDEWKAGSVNWLEEISEYSQRSLTPDDSIVDSLDAVAALRAGSDPKVVVNMRITEVAKEAELIDQLGMKGPAGNHRYRVKPTRGTVDAGDKSYPLSTSLNITLQRDRRDLIRQYDDRATDFLQGLVQEKQLDEKASNSPNSESDESLPEASSN